MSTAEREAHEQAAATAFVETLKQAGWRPGQNIDILVRWGNGDGVRMAANAREIVELAPDVVAVKGASLPAVGQLTTTIPIVFVFLSDAVAMKYVAGLARPGGNITGFTSGERELVGKRLQLLRETAPTLARALYLRGVVGTEPEDLFARLAQDAARFGFAVTDGAAQQPADIEPLIARFADQPGGGLIVAFNAFNTTHSALIVSMAAKYRLPAIYPGSFYTEAGGLVSYGFDQNEEFQKAAVYVDRILRGAKPGDLPVQEPTRFQLIVNTRTAKALGLTIPQSIFARADEVIE
jgi:putative ABC transport system substrate-binding protein